MSRFYQRRPQGISRSLQATHDRQVYRLWGSQYVSRCSLDALDAAQGLTGMRERPPGKPAALRKKEAWSATAPRVVSSDTFFRTGMRPKPFCSCSYLPSGEAC